MTNIGLDWIDLTIPSAPQCLSHTAPGAYLDFLTRGEISVVSGGSRVRGRSKFKCDTNVHCVNDKQYIKYRRPLKLTNRKICFLQV